MNAYEKLMTFQRDTEALGYVAERLHWDRETVMPHIAAHQRSEEIAALEKVLHTRRTDPRIGEWLEKAAAQGGLDDVAEAQLRHIRRSFTRAVRIPEPLAAALARTTSVAQGVWAKARSANDFSIFAPTLKDVLDLKREQAAALANGGDPYDALLDDYEPGATGARLDAMFGALRPRLVALRDRVLGSNRAVPALRGRFDEAKQMILSVELAAAFGYDVDTGRIDKAVHPFSSGSGLDVRITTRTNPDDPFNCFYSTIHEAGHAVYEQSIDPVYALTPLGRGVSMGVHESQSRICENQLGRGRAFTGWLFGRMRDAFDDFGIDGPEDFHAVVNRVWPGRIRTEADEVHYNLHILLRFDLERALISGDLQVSDLQAAWDDRFEADFGVKVGGPAEGCLQDVHWSLGLFGYFPTYALGNVYAGCLYKALRSAIPALGRELARGDARPAIAWLREKLQRHGGLYRPETLIERVTGHPPTEAPLLDYLDEKFGAIYGV